MTPRQAVKQPPQEHGIGLVTNQHHRHTQNNTRWNIVDYVEQFFNVLWRNSRELQVVGSTRKSRSLSNGEQCDGCLAPENQERRTLSG